MYLSSVAYYEIPGEKGKRRGPHVVIPFAFELLKQQEVMLLKTRREPPSDISV